MSQTPSQKDYSKMSATELERETALERERIAETVGALQDKLSMRHVVDEALNVGAEYGADVGRSLGRTLRDNPVPVALIGIGLVWLMTRGNASTNHYRSRYYREDEDMTNIPTRDEEERMPMTAEEEAHIARTDAMGDVRDGVAARMERHLEPRPRSLSAAATNGGNYASTERMEEKARRAKNAARHYADEAEEDIREGYEEARGAVSRYAHDARDAASDAYYRSRERAAEAYESAQEAAYETYYGTRRRARKAARYTARKGRDAGDAVADFIHEQPLVAGGIALALGAAIGGLLPRTRVEDDYFGETSDHLKQSARTTVRQEARKVRKVADAAFDEMRDVKDETVEEVRSAVPSGKQAVKKAKSRATKAAARVEEAAEDEAEKQDLAKPTVKRS